MPTLEPLGPGEDTQGFQPPPKIGVPTAYSDNYQNYVYLFNDKNEMYFTVEGDPENLKYNFDTALAYNVLGGLLVKSSNNGMRIVGGAEKDFPAAKMAAERIDEVIIGETNSDWFSGDAVKTNDPGNSPFRSHIFNITPSDEYEQKGKTNNNGAYTYAFYNLESEAPAANFFYTFTLPNQGYLNLQLRMANNTDYFKFPNDIKKPKYLGGTSDVSDLYGDQLQTKFLYYQDIDYALISIPEISVDPGVETHLYWEQYKQEWQQAFGQYFAAAVGNIKDNHFVPHSSIDITTKIGIPYDYQTMLFDEIDAKTTGIKNLQPFYEKKYNFYNRQYEEMTDRLINFGTTDERALPSIYDFLYLSSQPSLGLLLKTATFSLKETNLQNLDGYLRSFVLAYEKVLHKDLKAAQLDYFVNKTLGVNTITKQKAKPTTLKELGWEDPNAPSLDPTSKQILFQNMDMMLEENIGSGKTKKWEHNPTWVNQLKTGIYFSQKSMHLFNETEDKDETFPYLMKINVPVEKTGPIARLLGDVDLLDELNTYAASITIPNNSAMSTYNNYFGAIINGANATNFNIINGLKLPTFKIYFRKRPPVPLTLAQLLKEGKNFSSYQTGGSAANPNTIPAQEAAAGMGNVGYSGEYVNTDPFRHFNSWKRRKLDNFSKNYNLDPNKPILYKVTPYKKDDGTTIYPPDWDPESLEGSKGPTLEIWAYTSKSSFSEIPTEPADATVIGLVGGKSEIWTWDSLAFIAERGGHYNPDGSTKDSKLWGHATTEKEAWLKANPAPFDKPGTQGYKVAASQYCYNLMKDGKLGTQTLHQCTVQKTKEYELWEETYDEAMSGMWNEKDEKNDKYWTDYVYKYTTQSSLYDYTDTEIGPEAAGVTEQAYAGDIYLDDDGSFNGNFLPNVLVYKGDKDGIGSETNEIAALLKKIKLLSFRKKLKKLFLEDGLMRTPLEIHNGKLAHQETLMYEIAKYGIHEGEEYYIQSIFLPMTKQNILSYYDTQVIPYKNYFYKIFAHKVIVGTEYKLENSVPNVQELSLFNGGQSNVDETFLYPRLSYRVEPFFQMVRVPYYNVDAVNLKVDKLNYSRIEDKPPLPPQVNIVPYKNVNNKVLILLNNSIGEIEQYPKPVFEDEWEMFDEMALAQDRAPGDKLIFKSDDASGIYHAYRTENIHTTYQDFGNDPTMKWQVLQSDGMNVLQIGELEQTSLVDRIAPNKDYYYFFRFVDLHQKMSNPTIVYKVRMISEPGAAPFLQIEAKDISEIQKNEYKKSFSTTKGMKKYLLIQPTILQDTITTPTVKPKMLTDGLLEGNCSELNVKLGNPAGKSVFGKKFKLRITSKQTGKKIDINLSVKPPENIINV